MKKIDEIAFSLACKIDSKHPLITRENLIKNVAGLLIKRGFQAKESRLTAIRQVAEYEHKFSLSAIDFALSTSSVIFVHRAGNPNPQAVFLNDIINALDTQQVA